LFCKEIRESVVKENPGIGFGAIGKKMGQMWRDLPEEEKDKYRK
jgi:hypothetical protein